MEMRLAALLLLTLVQAAGGERPKVKDSDGVPLIKFEFIGKSCGSDSYMGFGIITVKGIESLEKCENFSAADTYQISDKKKYEKYKCDNLRLHGEIDRSGNCVCKNHYAGSACHEYIGCPDEHKYMRGASCTDNVCYNGGELAVGSKHIECICPVPWDGKLCDRLACWRKTKKGEEKRFRNDKNKCICGAHYTGEDCEEITSCARGNFTDGRCNCPDGFGGEICDITCRKGEITCAGSSVAASILLLLAALFSREQ